MSKLDDLIAQERLRDEANRDRVNAEVMQADARQLSATPPMRGDARVTQAQDQVNRELVTADHHRDRDAWRSVDNGISSSFDPYDQHGRPSNPAIERARDEQNRSRVMAQVAQAEARDASAIEPRYEILEQADRADNQVAAEQNRINRDVFEPAAAHDRQQAQRPRGGRAPQMHNPIPGAETLRDAWDWLTD